MGGWAACGRGKGANGPDRADKAHRWSAERVKRGGLIWSDLVGFGRTRRRVPLAGGGRADFGGAGRE
jgi:hypothetical protein